MDIQQMQYMSSQACTLIDLLPAYGNALDTSDIADPCNHRVATKK